MNSKRRKDREKILKNNSICETTSKYRFMKSMYKIITSLCLQGYSQTKSSLKECLINGLLCKNRSLKIDKTSRQHFVFQKQEKLSWIYCNKLLLQTLATLFVFMKRIPFFISLVLSASSLKKMNFLRISKAQKLRKFKNNNLQTKFTGSNKKIVFLQLIINSKFCYGWLHPQFSKFFNPFLLCQFWIRYLSL